MAEGSDTYAFYVVREGDQTGETARGPFNMRTAELEVGEQEQIITRRKLNVLRGVESDPGIYSGSAALSSFAPALLM